MIEGLLAGLGIGTGLWCMTRGLLPPRLPLARLLAGLETTPPRDDGRSPSRAAVAGLARHMAPPSEALERDLRVAGSAIERHVFEQLACGLVFLVLPLASAALASSAGVGVPWGLTLTAAAALAPVGFVLPRALLRTEAERKRRDARHALGAYLDLVVVIVAGGGGIETALYDAADAGDGWAFTEVRRSLEAVRLAGRPLWEAFDRLGTEFGVAEFAELAASLSLAGEHGARIRASLSAKAVSLREHQLAETEAEAQAATERMAVPVVLMLFGFLLFVGYPAVARVLTSL